jgi:hypothetical protein
MMAAARGGLEAQAHREALNYTEINQVTLLMTRENRYVMEELFLKIRASFVPL